MMLFRKIDPDGMARRPIIVMIDGIETQAEEGEPVAAILLRISPHPSRATPVSGSPRAPFCMMGACFDCLAEIDGVTSMRSCLARAEAGMRINRQWERPDPRARPAI